MRTLALTSIILLSLILCCPSSGVVSPPVESTIPAPTQPPPTEPPATPIPTATSITTKPAFEEIRSRWKKAKEDMTNAQRQAYRDDLEGLKINQWTGWVYDVREKLFGGYELLIDMDPPALTSGTHEITFDIPDELALQFQKDQKITFSGEIASATSLFDHLYLRLTEVTIDNTE